MGEPFSERQIKTITSIPEAELDIHCGPMGCGKTFSVNVGLGLACKLSPPPKKNTFIALIGRTMNTVKSNICNDLAEKFGENFRYDAGSKDGYVKDALLFGHRLRLIGLNDVNGEKRIRGLNSYKVIGDEVSTWSKENYELIHARLRGVTIGGIPDGWKVGFIGTTNPDSPQHWLKLLIDKGSGINYIKWTEHDNITSGAKDYYNKLRRVWANDPSNLARYIAGDWVGAQGLIYKEFKYNTHVLSRSEVRNYMPYFKNFRLGIDFGASEGHATVILVVGVTEDDEQVVVEEKYLKDNVTTSVVCNIVRDIIIRYEGRIIYTIYDSAARALYNDLVNQGFANVEGADKNVESGIDYVRNLFNINKLLICEDCENLLRELLSYQFSDKKNGKPVKENDDCVDALRYVTYTLRPTAREVD